MRINHNITALNTYRQLGANTGASAKNLEKLSSGLRINRAGDDAAGLAISEKMRGQIRGLEQAQRNSQDAISLVQTAEGALNETHSILQRMKELATQAANGTYTDTDRAEIQKELNQLTSEINRIGNTTEFNTKKVLNGDISAKSGIVTVKDSTFAAGGTGVTGVEVDKKSSLQAGNYSVVVADSSAMSASAQVYGSTGIADIKVAPDANIPAGDYRVNITQTQTLSFDAVGSTKDDALDAVTVNNAIAAADSYEVIISRTDTTANFDDGGNTGITAVSIAGDAGVDGSYTIKSTAVVSAVDQGSAADTYVTSLNFSDNAAVTAGTGLGIRFDETTTGQYSATLVDADGNDISDAVILDNNIQTYEFHSTGIGALGISFTTVTDVNNKLDTNGDDGEMNQFDVDTKLELFKGTDSQGIVTILNTDTSGAAKITDANGVEFTLTIGNGDTLITGQTTTFDIDNALEFSVDGGNTYTSFTAGDTLTIGTGVQVTTGTDMTKYAAGTGNEETSTIVVANQDTFTATLQTSGGTNVSGVGTISNLGTNGSYNFGNGVSFTTGADPLAAGNSTFTVDASTVTNATLIQGTTELATQTNISAGTIDFGNGVKADVSTLANGTATFEIEGSIEDKSLSMQVGANQGQGFTMHVNDMRSAALGIAGAKGANHGEVTDAKFTNVDADVTNGTNNAGVENALDVSTHESSAAAIKVFENAINSVSAERSRLGAYQNRLEHTINNLGTSAENLTAAESRIRDVDMAKEMMEFTKNNILSQAAQAMLAQANQQPQGVLQLLR